MVGAIINATASDATDDHNLLKHLECAKNVQKFKDAVTFDNFLESL